MVSMIFCVSANPNVSQLNALQPSQTTMSELVFYDIVGKNVGAKAWSPSTWIIRFALNYKGLNYRTEWIEFPDVEAVCKNIGAAPTGTKPDGVTPRYTVPVLYDPSTQTVISDSSKIADYLEKTYPDRPTLVPAGTRGLQAAFRAAVMSAIDIPLYMLCILPGGLNLSPRAFAYYRTTREAMVGKKLEEITPEGEESAKRWRELEAGLTKVATWFVANGDTPFIGGDVPCFGDVLLAARLAWPRAVWGEESDAWKRLSDFDEESFALNIKGLKYRTEWVEYPDIEGLCKKLGAGPTGTQSDGSPYYTLPVIYDPSTHTVVADSIPIAEYLDDTYPDTPRLFAPGTRGLHAAFRSALAAASRADDPLWNLIVRTREADEGKTLEEIAPEGEVRQGMLEVYEKQVLVKIASWYQANGNTTFIMGDDIPSNSDILVVSRFMWAKQTLGADSEVWTRIVSVDGGRWGRFMQAFEKYTQVV
ncbi:hypothetical protein EUX98_g3656 [Antrodiella citrinella]|uniref:GST N-terminal domain-containing protein n=1 Tax=Antrodiella citrinella TaxID=2447956 RepID=A0A4S4MVY9_9APHY|nr:hypothetical protein EUX98_g3656 [Antrodiella citrinella]